MIPTASVPIKVARGMVRAGSLTRAAGTAAHSKPSIAHKVRAAAAAILFGPTGVGANSAGWPPPPKTIRAMTMAATSGMILRTLVRIWTPPDTWAPVQATAVNRATKAIANSGATAGAAKKPGASVLR